MMSAAVSQKAIADALGITQPGVAKHIRKGMPVDSVESALAWHRRNVRPQRSRPRRARIVPRGAPEPVVTPRTPAEAASAATTASSLEELAELRTIARRGLADAQVAGDDYGLRAWTLAQAKIIDQAATTEERLLAISRAKGELLTVGEAREAFGTVLLDVRKLLDAAPAALAAKANPSDVHHARQVIEDWVRGALRTLYRGTDNPEVITSGGSE